MEIYVNDMQVKSAKARTHKADLRETFKTLRKYNMKLNPAKCAFGVRAGKFLGYMVTERGVEANPKKAQAIINMQPPRNIREVQILTGSLTALSRFISKVAEKTYSFFKIIRKGAEFSWDEGSTKAFEELKGVLASLPLLAKPKPDDKLYLYLAIGEQSIISVLVKEDQDDQIPVYYTSKMLQGVEARYPEIKKLGLALVTTVRKLRPYFLSHTIIVPTRHPLNLTLGKIDTS